MKIIWIETDKLNLGYAEGTPDDNYPIFSLLYDEDLQILEEELSTEDLLINPENPS